MKDRELLAQRKEFLTAKEAAEKIRTSEAMFFEWVRNGTLTSPVVARIGRKIIVNARELQLWLERGGTMQKEAQ